MATRTIKKMLGNLPVGVVDIVRLFVETIEVGSLDSCNRSELIAGFRQVVRAGVQAVKESEHTLPFGVVVERCIEMRQRRRKSTLADWRSYAGRMARFRDWGSKPLRGIKVEECREMLQSLFGHSVWALRKGRSVLHALFSYGIKQGLCEKNPVDAIESPCLVEQRIEPLTMSDIHRLVSASKGTDMEPAVSLMLWCGVRPAEVQRLTWDDIDTTEGVVYISPEHSKTGGARLVPLRGGAVGISTRGHRYIAPRNWAKRWRELRRMAGLTHWQQDALRHTFASYHLRHFCNPPQLQAEMGHRDSGLLRTRYVNLRGLTEESAKRFWRKV